METTRAYKPCDYYDYTPYDGYAWMERQIKSIHGQLYAIAEYGEWPYLIAMRGKRGEHYIIKTFCEHDENTWIYGSNERDAYEAHLNELRKEAE